MLPRIVRAEGAAEDRDGCRASSSTMLRSGLMILAAVSAGLLDSPARATTETGNQAAPPSLPSTDFRLRLERERPRVIRFVPGVDYPPDYRSEAHHDWAGFGRGAALFGSGYALS